MNDEPICDVDGCDRPTRTHSARWCKRHYMRWYRHGDPRTKLQGDGHTVSLGRRYISRNQPNHPIAPPCGRVWVHRVVLYDAIGDGVHACHWCDCALEWTPALASESKLLTVDHLNGDGADNRLENLVSACGDCNSRRAQLALIESRRASGRGWRGIDGDREMARRRRRACGSRTPPGG